MMWDEDQKRLVRERRDRQAELYVTARDAALDVLVSTGQAKPSGTWRQPPYLTPPEVIRSPEARDRALAKLGAMVPGIVRRGDS